MNSSRKHQNQLLALLSKNKVCFDCTAKSPTCVNMTIGSFVCIQCAGFLREFGHRIKSVTASTFSPEEVSDLSHKGNDYAAKTWLAVWIESDDPKPKRDNPKKIKDYMKKKYVLKTFYWDPSTSRSKVSSADTMVDWSEPLAVEEPKAKESLNLTDDPFNSLSSISVSASSVNNIKSTADNLWDDFAFTSREKVPSVDSIIDWSGPLAVEEPKAKESLNLTNDPFNSLSSISVSASSVNNIKSTAKPEIDNSWADFASAFPGSSNQPKKVENTVIKKEILLIPNIKIQQDVQLDPFESVNSVNTSGKYDAFKDLAGLSLSEPAPKLPTSPKKFENKALDLSKFVEISAKSKYPWEKSSELPSEKGKSELSQFQMNPFAFDEVVSVSENDNSLKASAKASSPVENPVLNPLEYNEWNAQTSNTSEDIIKNEAHSDWTDHGGNPINSDLNDHSSQDIYEPEWNKANHKLESGKDDISFVDSQWPNNMEISSSYNFQETSTRTLFEDHLNDQTSQEKSKAETNITQAYIPYELDSNVWG